MLRHLWMFLLVATPILSQSLVPAGGAPKQVSLEDLIAQNQSKRASVSTTDQNPCAVDGVIYLAGGGCFPTLASAFGSCHSPGCTIDMRGAFSPTSLELGSFDPGNNGPFVTVLFGPYTYTATTLTIRSGTRLIGESGTTIVEQSDTAPLVQGPPGGKDQPAINVLLDHLMLLGPRKGGCTGGRSSATGDGIYVNANVGSLGGVWYSTFRNLTICQFGGNLIHFMGASSPGVLGVNQFNTFYSVVAIRALQGGSALRLEGADYQFFFVNCEFDGNYLNAKIDTSPVPNVFIGAGTGSGINGYPYNIAFYGATIQGAAIGVQIDGASNVIFDGSHHEQLHGVYKITYGANGAKVATQGVVIEHTSFNADTGVERGTGYLLDVTTPNASGIVMDKNIYASTDIMPDHIALVATGADVSQHDWSFGGQTGGTKTMAFSDTVGTCKLSAGQCSYTFQVPYAVTPVLCVANGQATANAMTASATATGVIVISSLANDSQSVTFRCGNTHN